MKEIYAFPVSENVFSQPGLSKRELFTAIAWHAFLIDPGHVASRDRFLKDLGNKVTDEELVAKVAVQYTDAFIKALGEE